ncbi:MAG: ABC transporter permease subunit [Nitrosomonas sp.]|uniref:ABC transporter permease subunit n=1 Tax=Nitrosomonas sp. TaxID=42353 RepID=UPI002736F275|nr:ABC transporter permease subunit [Nitrosomonas sp.]MDP1933336.1 ABC transporter permease subunit [Nitrosomonas sp.]MDP3280301.1 ABC transporter permease subunit [Nitrosomonas sp.]MDP3663633.1 ABC transporter permease subunit [Nitrosomonas sp.]MDZ4105527.1 ABC transporter permease subunit [Nitrosomonas sp.]
MIVTIIRKELSMLFISPLAWILLALIQLILTWVFLVRLDAFLEIQSQLMQIANPPGITEIIISPVFAMAAIILLMVTPLLSMRLLAEERRNHTLTLLISAPVSMTDIVIGKFLGLMVFFLVVITLIVALSISLRLGGALDFGLLLSNTLGLLLLTACFSALGLYISSLTAQPVIAAIGTLGVLLGLWMINLAASETEGWIQHFSLLQHFEQFNQGLIDTLSIAYFIIFIVTFLVLTIRRLDGERLHG